MSLTIIQADLNNPGHEEDILFLTNAYAKDEMGAGKALPAEVQKKLVSGLKEMPTALIFIAYEEEKPVGIANCFYGYSTFYAQKLINIHDLGVIPDARGKGIGRKLLEKVHEKAKSDGCCKVTLEVLENNPARRLYERAGFRYGEPPLYFMTQLIKP